MFAEECTPLGGRELDLRGRRSCNENFGFGTTTPLDNRSFRIQIKVHAEGVFGQLRGAENRLWTGIGTEQKMHQLHETGFAGTISCLLGGCPLSFLGEQHIQAGLQISKIFEAR